MKIFFKKQIEEYTIKDTVLFVVSIIAGLVLMVTFFDKIIYG